MPHSAKMDTAALLAKLIKLSNSNTQFELKVTSFLNTISWERDLEYAILLTLGSDLKHLQPLWLADSTFPRLGPVAAEGNIIGRCLTGRQILLADQDDLLGLPRDWAAFVAPFGDGLMVTPLGDDKTCYGVLLLLRRIYQPPNSHQSLVMEAVASELTIAIKNVRLATDTRKRLSILNVLSDLGRTLSSTIDVEKVMSMIPQIASGIFLADGCTVNILDEEGQHLILASQYGLIPPAYNFERYHYSRKLPSSVAAALSRQTSFSGLLKEDPCAMDLSDAEMMGTIISCPLIFQGPHQGSISLFNKLGGQGIQPDIAPRLFDRDDFELLFSMNNIISGVLENAITFRKVESLARTNEKIITYLSILHEISSAMMTTVRYDELVWIIIRALTEPRGLGFDQVFILLLEESEEDHPSTLVSSAFWTYGQSDEEPVPEGGLAELLKNPSKEEATRMLQRGMDMRVRIPIFPESPRLLSRVVLEKKAMLGFRAFDNEQDERLRNFGLKAYAAVPMVAKNREVGVIAVDRSLSGEPLTLGDLRDLTMLANQAGLAIENARLYDDLEQANRTLSQVRGRLIDAEKAAAQGEMGTHLAHEVRNPLVSIGGFTQRLLKKMSEDDPLRKYAEVIWEEVSRVNKVLNNILDYSRNTEGLMREFRLEDKVAEAIGTLKHEMERKGIALEFAADPELPPVSADDSQVMHIVLNIIYNASQAMSPSGGRIHIRLFETRADDESYVACEITDTGPGIPPDILPDIFTPFYTSKSDGTGLGLAIVKKIVERYNGRIQVSNHPSHIPDSGASFTFMFPEVQSGALKIPPPGQE
ncbi:MAG: GAF domain-containing protein [Candidatus Adiutrix sp.]|jgi:signal transduction histidine kinase|nr:GAF domain-containing protein [Candidatus Adiutrix sp.]